MTIALVTATYINMRIKMCVKVAINVQLGLNYLIVHFTLD